MPTAQERIAKEWADRAGQFRELFERYDKANMDAEDSDVAYEELQELPLGRSTYKLVRIDLSTGGPGDWLEALYGAEGELQRITYHFAPWFDHAELNVTEDEWAQRFVEWFNVE